MKEQGCVCVCVFAVVSGCHVNHSGSLSLSIIASCCGNDTQPGFDITTDEWHFTQVCTILRALSCMCVILCVIVFSFPDLPCFESYIYKTAAFSECVPGFVCLPVRSHSFLWLCVHDVCVCVCALLAQKVSFLILPSSSTNHFHLYFLFFFIYQLFTELKPLSPRYGWNLPLFSSYSSYVTSASIYNIPPTIALVCFSTHCMCMWTLDCSQLPGQGWTQPMTLTSASNGSVDLGRFT